MKQEQSILQWASLLLEEEVRNVGNVQDVNFVRNLLWRIDHNYFGQWEEGRGNQSLTQVLQTLGKYFQEEIGTNIQDHIDRLNVYKSPMDVWELILGIAIKGNNRGQNITLILDMDHTIQAQLVGIVSAIIDKFGQSAAQSSLPPIDQQKQEQPPPTTSEQQMLLDLATENQQLNQYINQIESQLQKQKERTHHLNHQKKDVQYELTMLKHQKTAFIEILYTANRTQSRIFDDGEESALRSTSLSELANDISLLVRGLKKKINEQLEKSLSLQQSLSDIKKQAIKCAEQNESYLLQIGNINAYENEIEQLRQQLNQIFSQNSQLIDKVNILQDQKLQLFQAIQLKQTNKETELKEEQNLPMEKEHRGRKGGKRGHNVYESASSSDSKNIVSQQEGRLSMGTSEGQRLQLGDQLRQPKLRTKLQRELKYLKKANQSLKQQNVSLKKANQSLQKSAQQFMMSNKDIIGRWEGDYQELLQKMNQLTQNQPIKEEEQIQTVDIAIGSEQAPQSTIIASEEISKEPEEEQAPDAQPTVKKQQIIKKQQTIRVVKVKSEKECLWQQIALKLKGIAGTFKQRQFSYQNTIHHLRTQNARLLGIHQQHLKIKEFPEQPTVDHMCPALSPRKSDQADLFHKIIRMDSNDSRQQDRLQNQRITQLSRISYGSVREGEDFDQQALERRRFGASVFYNTGSKIIEQIRQQQIDSSVVQSQTDAAINLNRKLYNSIHSSLSAIQQMQEPYNKRASGELEQKLKEQIVAIQNQYAELNSNYQEIFRKLQLYSQQLNQTQTVKFEYQQVLEQLKRAEQDSKVDLKAEIVQLRLLNNQLHQGLSEAAAQKQNILSAVQDIMPSKEGSNQQEHSFEASYRNVLKALQQIKMKFQQIMVEPSKFLSLKFEGSQEGQAQKFYQLYVKEKQKCQQQSLQLQLLSGTFLEYRNIIEF